MSFNQAGVAAFESRKADAIATSIDQWGGRAFVAPSMQEIPYKDNPEINLFAKKLMGGEVDLVIFTTGSGAQYLMTVLKSYNAESIKILSKLIVVARGAKTVAVLRKFSVPISITVPDPNTWQELLEELDLNVKSISLKQKSVAIQEYGEPNQEIIEALKQRGANIIRIPVYRWALPDNTEPLIETIHKIIEGDIQFVLFTNDIQFQHVLRIASENGLEESFFQALRKVVMASIGPHTTEAIVEAGLSVDFEPTQANMEIFVQELAQQADKLYQEKLKEGKSSVVRREKHSIKDGLKERRNSVFLKACRTETTDYTPVWLMRQAGRYMKEYRRIRDKVPFLELCKNKDLVAEVTITAVEKIKADAAIIFSDLLLIVEPLGLDLKYSKGDGPIISGNLSDIDRLREIDSSLSYVYEGITLTRSILDPKIPLIGFSGAPFTLASYMIEGGGSKVFLKTKKLMYSDSGAWKALMEKISHALIDYLLGQVKAGVDALQIFDSWVGCLGPEDYREYVLPYTRSVISALPQEIPIIHFGTGTGSFLKDLKAAGGNVIGLDYRVSLDKAWKEIGYDVGVQGNLDPVVLFSSREVIRGHVKRILRQTENRPGHIFNLGHGILPGTPVENVIALIDMVHELSSDGAKS